jgi:hypothetical protein
VVGGTDDNPQHAERLYGVPLEDLSDPRALPDDAMVDVYLSNDNSKDTTELDSASFRQTLWEDVLRLRSELKEKFATDIRDRSNEGDDMAAIDAKADAMAAIDARIEDHWDPAWGSSPEAFGSIALRRRYIGALDAILAQYGTVERFATLDVDDLVSRFGFGEAHRDRLQEYRNQTDEPPVLTGVGESQLERVSREEWDTHMPLILKRRLGQPACRSLVKQHFDRLELALPRKGGDSGLLSTLLGLD